MKTKNHQRIWRRSQMEFALWRYYATYKNGGADPEGLTTSIPSVFKSRVKKMLNMDRIPKLTRWEAGLEDQWAFYEAAGEGTGSEEHFSVFHAFMMGLALDLLNDGMKHSDAIFLLKHDRPRIQKIFDEIYKIKDAVAPVNGTMRRSFRYEDYPNAEPIWKEHDSAPSADFTVWMLVRRSEMYEVYPTLPEEFTNNKVPFFMQLNFEFGLEDLKNEIFAHLNSYRHVLIIELADLALTLPKFLEKAPRRDRGRPKSEGVDSLNR